MDTVGPPKKEDITGGDNLLRSAHYPVDLVLPGVTVLTRSHQDGIRTAAILHLTLTSPVVFHLKQGRRHRLTQIGLKTGMNWDLIKFILKPNCHHADQHCYSFTSVEWVFLYLITSDTAVRR